MTVEEIFSKLASQMVEGLMLHSKMADYYGFLGFEGYSKCHRYHYFEENKNYRKISDYYLHHYDKIIEELPAPRPDIIPDTWFKYKRNDVSSQTRKVCLQAGLERWISWETDSKQLYEKLYMELINLNECASAFVVNELIKDVDNELAMARQELLEKNIIDYNINDIILEQEDFKKIYENKLKELELC